MSLLPNAMRLPDDIQNFEVRTAEDRYAGSQRRTSLRMSTERFFEVFEHDGHITEVACKTGAAACVEPPSLDLRSVSGHVFTIADLWTTYVTALKMTGAQWRADQA